MKANDVDVALLRSVLRKELEECKIISGSPTRESKWGSRYVEVALKITSPHLHEKDIWHNLHRSIIDRLPNDLDNDVLCFPTGKLSQLVPTDKFKQIENDVTSFILSIPKKYSFFLKLSNNQPLGEPIHFADNIYIKKLQTLDPIINLKYLLPKYKLISNFIDRPMKEGLDFYKIYKRNEHILVVDLYGYWDGHSAKNIEETFLEILKSNLILAKAVGILEIKHIVNLDSEKNRIYILDGTENDNEVEAINLDNESQNLIESFSIHSNFKPNLYEKELISLNRLNNSPDEENIKPILASAQWAFDSLASNNETVAFIQMCIGLESILGDEKSRGGLTYTLADRCAYILGKSVSERRKYRDNFEKIYKCRCKIVHGRKIKLADKEREYLVLGREYLDKILHHELLNV